MDAAELLVYLEVLAERVPLHKLTVRIEVSDDFYDKDLAPAQIFVDPKPRSNGIRYLILHGD